MMRYPPAAKPTPGQVIATLYAAVNESVEVFTLDQARVQAAEPFAPDSWVPGHFYREAWCCWAACRSQTRTSANP